MFASLQVDGRAPLSNDCLKSEVRMRANSKADSLRMQAGIWSGPLAVSGLVDSSSFWITRVLKVYNIRNILVWDSGRIGTLFKSSHVNTFSYCSRRASAFDMSFAQTRFFQKRAGIPIDSERKSLIYDHALSMSTLVLPLGDGAIPPMASLVVLLRKCL